MLAAAKGARSVDGHVIGVTCRAFKRGRANAFVTDERPTETLAERLAMLIALGDAYIVQPGGTGTLLELADVWEHKNKGFAGVDKPILLLGDFWTPLVEMMSAQDARCCACVQIVNDVDSALGVLKELLK
jgi:predicted Rossmann-fold nucleotide-binding protein